MNSFGAFVQGNLKDFNLVLNILATGLMVISVVATIFSGYDYLKNGKKLFKNI